MFNVFDSNCYKKITNSIEKGWGSIGNRKVGEVLLKFTIKDMREFFHFFETEKHCLFFSIWIYHSYSIMKYLLDTLYHS